MVTKLDRSLRREVMIGREPWIVAITPKGMKLTRKGRRLGIELEWDAMTSGDAALALALNASMRERGSRRLEPTAKNRRTALKSKAADRSKSSAKTRHG